jgi:chromosome segregation ATPase
MGYKSTIDRFQDGDIQAEQALDELVTSLDSLEDKIGPLEESRKALRDHISVVLEYATGGKRTEVRGYELQITQASTTTTFDNKALEKLALDLVSEGQADIARRLLACKRETSRAGSLRIVRPK